MATIIKKTKQGRIYYYAVESARVNGHPRIVWQKYLGTLDTILKRAVPKNPDVHEVEIFEAGGAAALLGIINKINLIEIIDAVVPKRDQGPSVGQYIALAAINRVLSPCSKLQISEWYEGTVLQRLLRFPSDMFNSQRFWDHMNLILEEYIEEIQGQIAQKVRDLYGIDPEVLLYDTTNFFTYIASSNDRNTIARRGKSKAKRNDLRQVGLALLVTKDFHIPLFHKVYQGNIPDVSLFPDFVRDLERKHIRSLGPHKEATLVFDKGNISEEAMERLIISGQHFVCAVPKKVAQDFFSTSIKDFTLIPGVHGTRGLVKNIQLWDKNFVAVLTYSESLFTGQLCGITTGLQKCQKRLHDLGKELEGWLKKGKRGKRPTLISVKKSVKKILSSGEHLERLVQISYTEKNGIPQLEYSIDQNALEQLHQNELGRTLIISTRENWTAKEIISAYRGQNEIENAFKEMKNADILHWQPAFHWTDQKIKVHGLYCVIALLLATLAHKTVMEKGIEISLPRLFHELGKIREVATIFKFDDKLSKKNSMNITKLSPIQKKISDALEIAEVLKG